MVHTHGPKDLSDSLFHTLPQGHDRKLSIFMKLRGRYSNMLQIHFYIFFSETRCRNQFQIVH